MPKIDRKTRSQIFQTIRAIREHRQSTPTAFNNHFEIGLKPIQSGSVTTKTGPKMYSQQWQRTIRKVG